MPKIMFGLPTESLLLLWYILGGALILTDIFIAPIGLLFLGLGAISTGLALQFGLIDGYVQILFWAIATAIYTALLWRPLKRIRQGSESFSNIIGETAIVTKKITPKMGGEVKWSGTTMNAKPANTIKKAIDINTPVTIKKIEGNVLYVEE